MLKCKKLTERVGDPEDSNLKKVIYTEVSLNPKRNYHGLVGVKVTYVFRTKKRFRQLGFLRNLYVIFTPSHSNLLNSLHYLSNNNSKVDKFSLV